MSEWFLFAVILAVIAVLAFGVVALLDDDDRDRVLAGGVGLLFALLSVVFLVAGAFHVVSTRNVGIVIAFGKPAGTRLNGVAWTAPWQSIKEMDGAIQLQQFTGNSYDDHKDAIPVRLGNNSTAYANTNINWRIDPNEAVGLFLDYRTFENIRENLVDKQLQVALNTEFGRFNPLTQQQGADFATIAQHVRDDVQHAVGHRIEIENVFVPNIFYDRDTQDRINQFNIESQQTRIAEQHVRTAQQQAEANKILAQTVANDPLVIVAQCITQSLEKGQPTSGCWPLITNGQPLISLPSK